MDENAIFKKALWHKRLLLLCGILVLIIGIAAAAYVGEGIQIKNGKVEYHQMKVSMESGGTFVVFAILAGWIFYLGSGLMVKIERPGVGPATITIRRIRRDEAA